MSASFLATTSSVSITDPDLTKTIVWNSKTYDLNGNFNVTNGTFTAPYDGIYQFTAHVEDDNYQGGNSDIQLKILASNADYIDNKGRTSSFAGNTLINSTAIGILELAKNETVTCTIYCSDNTTIALTNTLSYFQGYLFQRT